MLKYNLKNKFSFLVKLIVIYFLIFLKTYAGEQTTGDIFVALGQKDAPVKIKIFSSLTCPHCANFHTKVV